MKTGQKTMFLMATSLAFTAGGILFCYLLTHSVPMEGKTMNAVLVQNLFGAWKIGSISFGSGLVIVTLISEACLLFKVSVNKREIHLTPIEYKLLVFLARHAGKVLTQSQILKEVWGPNALEQGQHLRVHMHQLRHKLEANPTRPKWLINEPGVGYRLKAE